MNQTMQGETTQAIEGGATQARGDETKRGGKREEVTHGTHAGKVRRQKEDITGGPGRGGGGGSTAYSGRN